MTYKKNLVKKLKKTYLSNDGSQEYFDSLHEIMRDRYQDSIDRTIHQGIRYAMATKNQAFLNELLNKLKATETVNIHEVTDFEVKEKQIWFYLK